MNINVSSEILKLKKVLIHEPGREIELVTPREVKDQNFIDIVHYNGAVKAHKQLRAVLERVGVDVKILEEELVQTLDNQHIKTHLISKTLDISHSYQLKDFLESLDSSKLATILLRGLDSSPASLTDYLVNKKYSIAPLPNLIFVRDIAMLFKDNAVIGSMLKPSRQREATIINAILKGNFDFTDDRIFLNGVSGSQTSKKEDKDFRIEGGDFHVINKNTLAIGLSERTSSSAIDSIIDNLVVPQLKDKNFNVIVVPLPKSASTIHLDMVFSQTNFDEAILFPPVTMPSSGKNIIRVEVEPNGSKHFHEYDRVLSALKDAGVDIKPILCANGEPMYQQREQWSSGCNFFTFAPGKILGYSFNVKTLEALNNNGYEIISSEDFLKKNKNIDSYKKLVVTIDGSEIARGSGGCRCMTMPLEREDYEV